MIMTKLINDHYWFLFFYYSSDWGWGRPNKARSSLE